MIARAPPHARLLSTASLLLCIATAALPANDTQSRGPGAPAGTPAPPDATATLPAASRHEGTTGTSGSAPAAVAGQPSPESVGPVKLRNESVDQVISLLERWTGRTVLRPPALPGGNYTLTLDDPVSRRDAVVALETLLNLNGVAVTPLGTRFLKATALNLARAESPAFIEGSTLDLAPSGRIASKLFELQFLRVSEFLPQIAAILNPAIGAAPVIFDKNNAALITDSISNLQRVELLLQRLDRPVIANNATKFYQLHSAKASDVASKLRTLLGNGQLQNQLGSTTSYEADDRTNQIVLVSDPRQQPFFDDLIARLDVQSDPNTRNEVIFLKNASAKEVATVLSELVHGKQQAARATAQTAAAAAPAAPGAPPAPNAPANAPAALPPIETTQEFSSLLTILPEERTNAVIVSGTDDDIRLIRDLVSQIDILLAQVRIEVVIAEVTLSDEATSGISELGLRVEGDKLVGFRGSAAGIDVSNGTISTGSDGSTDLAADIVLNTTPRKNNTNILSVPTIITTHNKEGSIFVGEARPVISSYINDTGSNPDTIGAGYRSTVTSKDIGIELKVKPLIGNDGSVQLEITQEVNDVLGEIVIDGNPQPRIGRRTTKSFVSVRSGDIIVLGGLQRNTRSRNTNRLGPIPIIGDLLGTRRRENTRTDLVFFLRPYVLTNTPKDNADAFRRIDAGPQSEAVRKALERPPPKQD